MKIHLPNTESDERAVSPVIGVILMVAITVILAAVIGAFVLNLGNQVGDMPPQASINVEDAEDDGQFYANHQNGDDITTNELRIVVRHQDGSNVGTINGSDLSGDGTFSPGDQFTLEEGEIDGHNFDTDTTYTFIFIHTDSGQTITTSEATYRE